MKILILFFVLWAIVSSSVAQPVEAKWVPIIGFVSNTATAFTDNNNRTTRYNKDGDKLNSLTILIVSVLPITVMLNDKATETKSMATRILVNCKSGLFLPMIEFYYNIDSPKIHDRPVGVISRTSATDVSEISKTSTLYQVACPEYI